MAVCWPAYILLLLVALTEGSSTKEGFDRSHTVDCSQIVDDWSLQENLSYLWNIVELSNIDRFAFLVGSPLIAILQAVLIFTLCKFRLYRSSPLDIILICFISELVLNLSFLANAIYYSIFSTAYPMPASFPEFCLITAVLNTFFTILEMLYLLWFLIYAVLSVHKSIKKNRWFETNLKHIIPLAITVISTILIGVLNWYGLSQLGFCSITSTRNSQQQIYFPIIQLSFSLAFVCFAFFAYRYHRRHMPEGVALNRRKFEENGVMSRFVIGMSIILLILAASTFGLYLNCLSPNPAMLVWATIFDFCRLFQFIYLIGVMLTYKKIGKKVKKVMRGLFSDMNVKSSLVMQEKRFDEREVIDFIDIGMKEKILEIQEEENQIDFIRITQVITILSGIKIAYQEYLTPNYAPSFHSAHHSLKSLHFQEEISFEIGPKLIKDYDQAAQLLPRISLLRGKFTVKAPRVFGRLLQQDGVSDVWRSFQLLENRSQLYNIVESDGGRSGEFFFFTSDNRFILKTLAKDQFLFLLQQIEEFYEHFQANPQTLIAKPYGMFAIENREIDQSYYILLMKNTAACSRDKILRTYDMKGSTDDRMTLKNNEEGHEAAGRVLKDLDFIRLEHQLNIDITLAKQLRMQLRRDTEFLKGLNLIDYSLLVMRVPADIPAPASFWSRLGRIHSTVERSQHYHISLIDYLQKWDLGKKSQKWWKNLFGKHDVSAQKPSDYQFRFMRFITEITRCDSQIVTREKFSRGPTFDPELIYGEALQKHFGQGKPSTLEVPIHRKFGSTLQIE